MNQPEHALEGPTVNYLLVDDRPENLHSLEMIIRRPGVRIYKATSGNEALQLLLRENDFAVALVDVNMPGINGIELAELMRGREETRHIPIIFLTAEDPVTARHRSFEGYQSGAVDFLYKPLNETAVRNKVDTFFQLNLEKRRLQSGIAARETFASILSHEIRTPLSGATLNTSVINLLLEKNDDLESCRDKIARSVESIEQNLRALDGMVQALLDVTHLEMKQFPVDCRRICVSEVISSAIEVCAARFDDVDVSRCAIDLEDEVSAWIDPDRMRQVVVNLVSNAAKYSKGKPVDIILRKAGDHFVLQVADQGPGIPAGLQQQVFEKYYRVDSNLSVAGLGIGLYIVREIVAAHGGTVEVDSREGGEGTCFTVKVPLRQRS